MKNILSLRSRMNIELIDFLALDSTRESLVTLLVDRRPQYHFKTISFKLNAFRIKKSMKNSIKYCQHTSCVRLCWYPPQFNVFPTLPVWGRGSGPGWYLTSPCLGCEARLQAVVTQRRLEEHLHWQMLSHVDSCWVMLSHVESCSDMLSHVESCWVILSRVESCWVILSRVESCWVMLSHVELFWVMLSHVESCWVMLSYVALFWVMLSHVESCWVTLSHVESCWVILSHVESCWSGGWLQ